MVKLGKSVILFSFWLLLKTLLIKRDLRRGCVLNTNTLLLILFHCDNNCYDLLDITICINIYIYIYIYIYIHYSCLRL